ncbi:MAG: hypothetical protein ACO3SP_09410 [Ilumatobacteraceae bacterium]
MTRDLEPAVAAGGDSGEPVSLGGNGAAADALRTIARIIVTETVPPIQMADCSARVHAETVTGVSLRPRSA